MLLQHKLEPMSLHYVGIANVANTQQLQPQFLKSCKTVKLKNIYILKKDLQISYSHILFVTEHSKHMQGIHIYGTSLVPQFLCIFPKWIKFIFHLKFRHTLSFWKWQREQSLPEILANLLKIVQKCSPPFATTLTTELSCFLFPLIICQMFLRPDSVGHDLERHIPACIRCHSLQSMSEHRQTRKVQELVCRPLKQDFIEGQKHFCNIDGPNEFASLQPPVLFLERPS